MKTLPISSGILLSGCFAKLHTSPLQNVSAAQNQLIEAKFSRHIKGKSSAAIPWFESTRPSQSHWGFPLQERLRKIVAFSAANSADNGVEDGLRIPETAKVASNS